VAARLSLVSAPESPRRAREFVIDRLWDWGHAPLVEKASLLTSEIVTNAVVHTGAPLVLEMFNLDDGILVTVNDADREPPRPRSEPVGPSELHGRGLAIVDALASEWGTARIPDDGKVVWFRLAAKPRSSRRPSGRRT
jgi:anti-sigma regulatory factor (Ser/Thr protein kinase)